MYFDKVKKIAKENGVSIRKVETEVGLSYGSISKWNVSSPSVDNLKKVAKFLGVNVEDLLSEEQEVE